MPTIKQLLEEELPAIIEKGYREACYYWQIIPTKQVLFKGFFSSKVYQEILNNQEILANLEVDKEQRKHFEKALQKLETTKSGIAFPANRESWIMLNPFYYQTECSAKLGVELAGLIAHEVAHAVIFNWDIWRGHDFPHGEITKYLRDYYLRNYDWERMLKKIKS